MDPVPVTTMEFDSRRFITQCMTRIGYWLQDHLNSDEYADLWANVGGCVLVGSCRPNWKIEGELEAPVVMLQRISGETEVAVLASGQYMVQGYYKSMFIQIHACTDDGVGGPITADDLSSAIEVICAKYADELEEFGITAYEITDSAAIDDVVAYQNTSVLRIRLLVIGSNIVMRRLELARYEMIAPNTGRFTDGATLTDPTQLELELLTSTTTAMTVTARVKNQAGYTKYVRFNVPMARPRGTKIGGIGDTEGDSYLDVVSITVSGGQAGNAFAIYNVKE